MIREFSQAIRSVISDFSNSGHSMFCCFIAFSIAGPCLQIDAVSMMGEKASVA
jgi:hypothetical protein